jgi:hypothetical protein
MLSILGVATLVLYRIAVRSKGASDIVWFLKLVLIQLTIYFAVVWLSLRTKDSRQILLLGLIFAALFRISILFSPPYLSDDLYRYVWDGRVQSAGINPYRYIPADESLVKLRDDKIYPNINRREYARTIYPPVAEGAFLLITRISESVTWMKAAMVGFEAIAGLGAHSVARFIWVHKATRFDLCLASSGRVGIRREWTPGRHGDCVYCFGFTRAS